MESDGRAPAPGAHLRGELGSSGLGSHGGHGWSRTCWRRGESKPRGRWVASWMALRWKEQKSCAADARARQRLARAPAQSRADVPL